MLSQGQYYVTLNFLTVGPVEETNRWMVSTEGHVVTEEESFPIVTCSIKMRHAAH